MLIVGLELNALTALGYVLWFLVFVWLVNILLTLYGLSQQKHLSATNNQKSKEEDAPMVSVLMPARNETQSILLLW